MMLFERYRAAQSNPNSDVSVYYSEAAVHDTAAITVQIRYTIWPELSEFCFWLLDEVQGLATLPQFIYEAWEENSNEHDDFVITFTDLRDFIMFKLRYSDHIGDMQVHTRKVNGDFPTIHTIQNLDELLEFRPHLKEQLDNLRKSVI